MIFLKPFKLAKHKIFIARKYGIPKIKNTLYPHIARHIGYEYSDARYQVSVGPVVMPSSSTFLVNHLLFAEPQGSPAKIAAAPQQVFTFWFGGEMSDARQNGIKILKESNPNLQFHLVTEDNLDQWVKDDFPLHPAFFLLELQSSL